MIDSKPNTRSPIAVVVVHGVGDPLPGEASERIAEVLLREPQRDTASAHAPAFTESRIRIPARTDWGVKDPKGPGTDPGVSQSQEALAGLAQDGSEDVYGTTRRQGTLPNAPGERQEVHIYELHWGDLSRAPGLFTAVIMNLYQLAFHLVVLGMRAVRLAAKAHPTNRLLERASNLQIGAVGLLPTAIPICNLYLLAAAVPLLALFLPETADSTAGAGLVALSFLALLAAFGISTGHMSPGSALLLSALAGTTVLFLETPERLATIGWIITTAAIYMAWQVSRTIVSVHERLRWRLAPHIGLAIVALFAAQGAWVVQTAAETKPYETLLLISAHVVHGQFFLLQCLWLILFAGMVVAFGFWFVQRVWHGQRDVAIQRALMTGTLGLVLSSTLFYLITVVLWAAVLEQIREKLRTLPLFYDPPFSLLYGNLINLSESLPIGDYADGLFRLSIGDGIDGFLLALVLCAFIALAAILPSAWYDSRPRGYKSIPNSPNPTKAQQHETEIARNLGTWLDKGFAVLGIAGLVVAVGYLWLAFGYTPLLASLKTQELVPQFLVGQNMLTALGTMLAGAVPLLLLFRKQLPSALRNVLDILLDVDNWLFRKPKQTTPRGQILARALSLLQWLSRSDCYARIVFVAHSQGTVISADLLRLLQADEELANRVFEKQKPEIRLVTAGSPLRQLYAQRFPDEYGWAEQEATGGPDHRQLYGVKRWINIYCSGDYVGRALWQPRADLVDKLDDAKSSQIPAVDPVDLGDQPRQDVLLGAGAHTHYFDGDDPRVCAILRAQIQGE